VKQSFTPRINIFSKHKLFYTNSLQQEQRLNHRNSSMHELIMELFVCVTNHDVNMHARIQSIFKYRDFK
jgi:hypothetical protein